MKNLNFFINYFNTVFHPLVKRKWYEWITDKEDGTPTFVLDDRQLSDLPPTYQREILENKYGAMGIIALCEAFRDGPKIISPGVENCKRFEEIKLTLDYTDFRMPFPTLLVEFPQTYLETLSNRFTCPIPLGAIIHQKHELGFLSFVFLMPKNVPSTITMMNNVDVKGTIEDHFFALTNVTERADQEEMEMVTLLQRVLVNYCLFLTNYGHKVIGYVDRKGKVDPKKGEMVYIGMAQTLKEIYDHSPSEDKGGSHASPFPHWRKGHDRNQPYGPGGSLRKQIHIAPIFVRADRFGGDLGTTSVEFKGK